MGRLAEYAFRRHYNEVFRYLLRRTADAGEAEELTQQVFADAAAAERRLERDDRPVLGWLLVVAQRRWVDERRRRGRERRALETVKPEQGETEPAGPELAAVLRRGVAALPEEQREVVVLRLWRGESFREIAVAAGCSEAAVKMRFRRGLESLQELLRAEGYRP
jgi:RNA polymerase sigma-70 factor, ECF subfamily